MLVDFLVLALAITPAALLFARFEYRRRCRASVVPGSIDNRCNLSAPLDSHRRRESESRQLHPVHGLGDRLLEGCCGAEAVCYNNPNILMVEKKLTLSPRFKYRSRYKWS